MTSGRTELGKGRDPPPHALENGVRLFERRDTVRSEHE